MTLGFAHPGPQSDDLGSLQDHTESMDMAEPPAEVVEKPAEVALSLRALVLRRSLALALMIVVLAAGIITNVVVTNLVT